MRTNINKKSSKNKILIITLSALILGAGSYATYAYMNHSWPFTGSSSTVPSSDEENTINYNPPTKQEINDSQNAKKNNSDPLEQNAQNKKSNDLQKVSVAISFSDIADNNFEIRAFIPQVIEGSGVCTANLSIDGATVSESEKAFVDSTSSQCGVIKIPLNKLNKKGEWSLQVEYKSDTSEGVSEVIKVSIP